MSEHYFTIAEYIKNYNKTLIQYVQILMTNCQPYHRDNIIMKNYNISTVFLIL